jgi:hypothetical protein
MPALDDYELVLHKIRTQFTGATDKLLKKPRVITSLFTIEHM